MLLSLRTEPHGTGKAEQWTVFLDYSKEGSLFGYRVEGKGKEGRLRVRRGWILYAVLPAGCCVLSLSFLRDAVNKVVPFIPTEIKQESLFQGLYKYKILYILSIELYTLYVFDFAGCCISANKKQADKVTNAKQVLWASVVFFLPAAFRANTSPASN